MAEDILVVEDDAFTRTGIEGYLQSLGYIVYTAADTQTGWELAVTQRPQTAVIDIQLPLDGRTVPIFSRRTAVYPLRSG